MKVKVGDTVFDGETIPVMVILDPDDKHTIGRMEEDGYSKYCCYPDNASDETIERWMGEIDNVYQPLLVP